MTKQTKATSTKATTAPVEFSFPASMATKIRESFAGYTASSKKLTETLTAAALSAIKAKQTRLAAGKALAKVFGEESLGKLDKALVNRWQYICTTIGVRKTAAEYDAPQKAKDTAPAKPSAKASPTTTVLPAQADAPALSAGGALQGNPAAAEASLAAWAAKARITDVAKKITAQMDTDRIEHLIDELQTIVDTMRGA